MRRSHLRTALSSSPLPSTMSKCVRPSEPGRAVVADPEVIADYVASVGDIYRRELVRSWDRLVEDVRTRAAEVIDRDGAFVVEGDVGAFVCK